MTRRAAPHPLVILAAAALVPTQILATSAPIIDPNWNEVVGQFTVAVSVQVCVEPPLRRGKVQHDALFESLHSLGADFVRLQPWHPYPQLAVAELYPPTPERTYWDFRLIDPIVEDFFTATGGHPVVFDFGEIPEWMFEGRDPHRFPKDPDETAHNYGQGEMLRDKTLAEVRDYYLRLAGWYLRGEFVDELGVPHRSGHRYPVTYWEVLNEPELTHYLSPQLYTQLYDEIVLALRSQYPSMRFVGLALAYPDRPAYVQYFLDPANHRPGVPIDMISYHYYAQPDADESLEVQGHTFFTQADGFLSQAQYIEVLRRRLSPATGVYIDEVGSLTPEPTGIDADRLPSDYWHLSGAMFAYLYLRISQLGIPVTAMAGSELIDFPGQAAGSSLSNWHNGRPNARYRVLQLLQAGIAPGDRAVRTLTLNPQVFAAQAFTTATGQRVVMLVNKRNRPLHVKVKGAAGGYLKYVDPSTGSGKVGRRDLANEDVRLGRYGVALVTLPSATTIPDARRKID